jgi:hypothetical protein
LAAPSEKQSEAFCRSATANFWAARDFPLLLVLRGTGKIVGSSGLHHPDWAVPKLEIGWQETIDDQPDAVLASVARIGAITRDVLRCAAATGATPLSVADGIVRARIIRRA